MPRLIDSESRTDDVVAATNHVLVEHGPWGLTLRAIGKVAGVSPSSLLHHYGNREHLLRVCAYRTGAERMRRVEWDAFRHKALALLPGAGDPHLADLRHERAWQEWLALGRSSPWMQPTLRRHRDHELVLLAGMLGLGARDEHTTRVRALVDGLCIGVCDPIRPLELEQAKAILKGAVAGLAA